MKLSSKDTFIFSVSFAIIIAFGIAYFWSSKRDSTAKHYIEKFVQIRKGLDYEKRTNGESGIQSLAKEVVRLCDEMTKANFNEKQVLEIIDKANEIFYELAWNNK